MACVFEGCPYHTRHLSIHGRSLIAPHVALALVRLCFDSAAIAAYGVGAFIACIAPKRLGQAIAASSNFLIVAASSLALLSTFAWLPIEAAVIGESWQSALD